MKILVVGNGGREHALLWKLRRDDPHASLFVTLGNGGTAQLATAVAIDAGAIGSIVEWASAEDIDLVVVGPEAPLAAGLVDALRARGVPAFGPTAGAAAIEASKAFAKRLMTRARVPTAEHATFTRFEDAAAYLRAHGAPIVVKASGLAGGKGAVVCEDLDAALDTARDLFEGALGEAGAEVVIEERMEGEELSVFALCDGFDAIPMLPAQDHKRIGEGDVGPNTGGMGAYAPVSIASDALIDDARERIFLPTLHALRAQDRPFRGLLYAGLMLTRNGPSVVEFNCRFGDPETQAILPLLESSLLDAMLQIARGGRLRDLELEWSGKCALTTVLASAGYPGEYARGASIDVPEQVSHRDDVLVFHAGTTLQRGELVTSGGRVMAVTGLGATMEQAADASRAAADRISFGGKQFRRDIGWRELARHA